MVEKKPVRIVPWINMVYYHAHKAYRGCREGSWDLEDFIQEGIVILLESFESYKPERASFSTYLFYRLRGYLGQIAKRESRYILSEKEFFDNFQIDFSTPEQWVIATQDIIERFKVEILDLVEGS